MVDFVVEYVFDKVVDGEVVQQNWVRLASNGFMNGMEVHTHPETGETWPSDFRGVHCTTTAGAAGITRDRGMILGNFGSNAYCRLVADPMDQKTVVEHTIAPGVNATKNASDVLWEVSAKGYHKNTLAWNKSSPDRPERGTFADMAVASAGFIAH